jgi:hypothetical protein
LKGIAYGSLAAAAAASLLFVHALMPASAGAWAFIAAWLVLPYALLAAGVAWLAKKRTWALTFAVVSPLVALGGLAFLTVVVFLRPDAQGGIAVMFTPIYQAIAALMLLPICHALILERWRS